MGAEQQLGMCWVSDKQAKLDRDGAMANSRVAGSDRCAICRHSIFNQPTVVFGCLDWQWNCGRAIHSSDWQWFHRSCERHGEAGSSVANSRFVCGGGKLSSHPVNSIGGCWNLL